MEGMNLKVDGASMRPRSISRGNTFAFMVDAVTHLAASMRPRSISRGNRPAFWRRRARRSCFNEAPIN